MVSWSRLTMVSSVIVVGGEEDQDMLSFGFVIMQDMRRERGNVPR